MLHQGDWQQKRPENVVHSNVKNKGDMLYEPLKSCCRGRVQSMATNRQPKIDILYPPSFTYQRIRRCYVVQ